MCEKLQEYQKRSVSVILSFGPFTLIYLQSGLHVSCLTLDLRGLTAHSFSSIYAYWPKHKEYASLPRSVQEDGEQQSAAACQRLTEKSESTGGI